MSSFYSACVFFLRYRITKERFGVCVCIFRRGTNLISVTSLQPPKEKSQCYPLSRRGGWPLVQSHRLDSAWPTHPDEVRVVYSSPRGYRYLNILNLFDFLDGQSACQPSPALSLFWPGRLSWTTAFRQKAWNSVWETNKVGSTSQEVLERRFQQLWSIVSWG